MATFPMLSLNALGLQLPMRGASHEERAASFAALRGEKLPGRRAVATPPGKRAWPFHGDRANEELFAIDSAARHRRYGDAVSCWDNE